MSGAREVETFLQEIGLESCVQAVVHNGFYTSMEALRGANYEKLVDSGVRPVHAKLIISNLGSKDGFSRIALSQSGNISDSLGDEVGQFLRSIGLENCGPELAAAGFASVELLAEASMQDLLNAGLKPVHARLIASNLDSPSTAGLTPAAQRNATIGAEESGGLLGAPRKAPPRRARLVMWLGNSAPQTISVKGQVEVCASSTTSSSSLAQPTLVSGAWTGGCCLILLVVILAAGGGFGGASPTPALPPAGEKKGHEAMGKHKGLGKHEGGGGGEGGAHGGKKPKPM